VRVRERVSSVQCTSGKRCVGRGVWDNDRQRERVCDVDFWDVQYAYMGVCVGGGGGG